MRPAAIILTRASIYIAVLALACLPLRAETSKVAAWALNTDGSYRTDLSPDSFRASIGDKPARVVAVETPNDGLILLVVLDIVGDLTRSDTARKALVEAVKEMRPDQYVAVLRAQDGLEVLSDPSRDHALLESKILEARVTGVPGLLDTINEAASLADTMLREAKVRVATLYLTDGSIYEYRGDYTSRVINPSDSSDLSRRFRDQLIQERIAAVLGRLERSLAPLFFLHLQQRTDSLNVSYQNGITQFAVATQGKALFCRSVAEISPLLSQAVDQIKSQYMITIETPPDTGGPSRLRLEAADGSELLYREKMPALREETE